MSSSNHKYFVENKQREADKRIAELEQRKIQVLKNNRPENPDLLCVYKPETDCDLVYCVETFDKNVQCEHDRCDIVGSYVMSNETVNVGICRCHLAQYLKEDSCQFSDIIELPKDHDYPDALPIEDVE